MNSKTHYIIICLIFSSCSKYLDEVPDRSLAILTKVEEYQQLMNNDQIYRNGPELIEFGTDDLLLTNDILQSQIEIVRNAYIWAADIYEGNTNAPSTSEWRYLYENIYYANVTLDGLASMEVGNSEQSRYDEIKAQALFIRAFQFHLLQELYGQPYRSESASVDLGIPLKLSSNLAEKVTRPTVQTTFEQIIQDLETAIDLSPQSHQAENKYRVSKAASHALLSRIYLIMQDYERSLAHAEQCLNLYDILFDLNELSPGYSLPFPDNLEILFLARGGGRLAYANPIIDSALYGSYDENDLRKTVFFQIHEPSGTPRIKTLYSGITSPMFGIATDEMYLTRAECRARLGDIKGAIEDLNELLIHRYASNGFTPIDADGINLDNILQLILTERRKELVFRGVRWMDLRRLNQDPKYAVTLKRVVDGTEYTLEPNSPKYTYPIPLNEVAMNDLQQNER